MKVYQVCFYYRHGEIHSSTKFSIHSMAGEEEENGEETIFIFVKGEVHSRPLKYLSIDWWGMYHTVWEKTLQFYVKGPYTYHMSMQRDNMHNSAYDSFRFLESPCNGSVFRLFHHPRIWRIQLSVYSIASTGQGGNHKKGKRPQTNDLPERSLRIVVRTNFPVRLHCSREQGYQGGVVAYPVMQA